MKAKYYLRKSWNNPNWFMICQTANNVIVCDCPEKKVGELILNYLNSLPLRVLGHIKQK